MELYVWLGWVRALINLDIWEKVEFCIPNSRGLFQKTGRDSSLLGGHNKFEVVVAGRNPDLLMMVTSKEGSTLWACP